MKRWIALSMSLLMLVGLFAGCSDDQTPETTPTAEVTETPEATPDTTPDTTPDSEEPDTTPDDTTGDETTGDETTGDETTDPVAQAYADAIVAARDQEINDAYPVMTSNVDEYTLTLLGLTEADMASYALSISLMNVQAYGIAAIMPAEGSEQTVVDALNAYVALQQSNFETYLADQYEIAKAARVETLSDGTVLMVMCEDSDTVFEAIRTALEG